MPVKCDLSMTLSPAKNLSASSTEEFLSEIEPSSYATQKFDWSRVDRRNRR